MIHPHEEQHARASAAEAFAEGIGATPAVNELATGHVTRQEARILACLAEACDRFAEHAAIAYLAPDTLDRDHRARNAAVTSFYAHAAAAQRLVEEAAAHRRAWLVSKGHGIATAALAVETAP